jgi:iron complex outermembrane receptor protein
MGGMQRENLLNPHVEAASEALFGQVTVRVTGRLSATTGIRYTRERKTIANAGRIQTIDITPATLAGSAYAYTDTVRHDPWTPKFGFELQALENTLTYVSATRGFKSGGFNLTSTEPGRGYAPEWAWSYEAGLKTVAANGSGRVNLAAFRTSYTDLQVSTGIRPGVIDVTNAAAATIRGVELEGATRVGHNVHLGGHAAWLDARYDRYVATGVGGVMGDVVGNRLNNAPEWSARLWVEWSVEIGDSRSVSLQTDATWQTTVFYTPFNSDVERQPSYGLVSVSADYGPLHRRWSLSAYARNLTNKDYITGTFGTPAPAIGGRPGEPRQIGILVTLRN